MGLAHRSQVFFYNGVIEFLADQVAQDFLFNIRAKLFFQKCDGYFSFSESGNFNLLPESLIILLYLFVVFLVRDFELDFFVTGIN